MTFVQSFVCSKDKKPKKTKLPVNLEMPMKEPSSFFFFVKLSSCLSQECLKCAGERKGNYNSSKEEEGKTGGGIPRCAGFQDLPFYHLSLPSTSTHSSQHNTTWIYTTVTPQLHLILPTDQSLAS